jgi:hypothetical protein
MLLVLCDVEKWFSENAQVRWWGRAKILRQDRIRFRLLEDAEPL